MAKDSSPPRAPCLVLGVGNPSRGDDALGPLFVERAETELATEVALGAVEFLTDFQLQIEHALDLSGRARVIFVDASVVAQAPYEFSRVAARRDASFSSHAMSPESLLDTHRRMVGEPPEAWTLGIRGLAFELGEPLTAQADDNLRAALEFFVVYAREHASERSLACETAGRRLEIEGTVQGVGFRPWVYRKATTLGLTGKVWNTSASVIVEAFGPAPGLDALLRAIQTDAPPAAHIRSIRCTTLSASAPDDFSIDKSASSATTSFVLPPDLTVCDACLRDVADAADRHFAYVFTSCTDCGPRFSIATALPYDRESTTMAPFGPCAACAREYRDTSDRRFHAQTIACPTCGPRAWLATPSGEELPCADPIQEAAILLRAGKIIGVQGLGAFHLVCDAANREAVRELRKRKGRDAQPFAVMVASVEAARALAEFDPASEEALLSTARPIVLVPSRPGMIAPEVGGPSLRSGLLLPYTPLHHRLSTLSQTPLVVTSGNPSGGPAVIDQPTAVRSLAPMVDAFVLHDRAIERRVEDSVVAACGGAVRVMRRSRGLAPAPIELPVRSPEPVLAVGAHSKNTACLVVENLAYLTPHLGDLTLAESEYAWKRDVESFERLLGVRARVVAHDLHPDYASTRYAVERDGARRIGVQHHAAHLFAAMAELGVREPVIGVILDGTGFGTDGTSWGAEFLLVDGPKWTRSNSFRPLPLPGGDRAIRETWRAALGALCDAYGTRAGLEHASTLRLFDDVPMPKRVSVARMIEAGVSTARARGMGRWFDAIGALSLAIPSASFDGHVPILLEEIAAPGDFGAYPVALPSTIGAGESIGEPHEVDLRPTVRAVVEDLQRGTHAAIVSARFHQTIVEAISSVVARTLEQTGLRRVVLSGGSMQNRRLAEGLSARLGASRVLMPRDVPVNDGGIALGQAFAAVLALRAEAA